MKNQHTDNQFDGKWHLNDSGGIGAPLYPEPGVYAIYFDDRLIYIGKSKDVQARLAQHLDLAQIKMVCAGLDVRWTAKWGGWVMESSSSAYPFSYKWAMCPDANARSDREARLIRRLRPAFNIQHAARKVGAA